MPISAQHPKQDQQIHRKINSVPRERRRLGRERLSEENMEFGRNHVATDPAQTLPYGRIVTRYFPARLN